MFQNRMRTLVRFSVTLHVSGHRQPRSTSTYSPVPLTVPRRRQSKVGQLLRRTASSVLHYSLQSFSFTHRAPSNELVHRAPDDRVHAASTASSSNASNHLNSRFILRDQSHHEWRLPVSAAYVSAVRDAIPSDAQRDAFARARALSARATTRTRTIYRKGGPASRSLGPGHQHIGEGDRAASRAVPQSAAAAVAVNTAGEAAINNANGA